DATGHDAVVLKSMEDRGMIKTEGFDAMWVSKSEDALVEKTGEVYPGVLVCGMAAATMYGLPRMGPTFGGMLLSGKKVAEVAMKLLKDL
ncbi:MAG: ribose 1,5-bisphosphate isomerase, partial [Methanosarcinales archaeon]|nr:ribose 1,5-bisphosphate isomerase [Methanosarcinales archaeon]